jgi:murein tripeptide amidase MpaA
VLKISNGPGKKALFTDAAIHAREWITPPVILKIAFELLENYQANKALVDMVDWYILPVANPDGYVYSWESVKLILIIICALIFRANIFQLHALWLYR